VASVWAGYVLSCLIFTPLITTWLPFVWKRLKIVEYIETGLAFAALLGVTSYLFWVYPIAQWLSVTLIYAFLGVFAWISLRLGPRSMTMALFLTLVFGVFGTLVFPHTDRTVADRLFSVELFLELIAVIFLAFSSLIEERRKVRADLEETVAKLHLSMAEMEKADKAKNEFIAILAHELRNPLAPVMSTLELLRFREKDAESLALIETAEGQTHLMRRLLDDLLDVARVTQQKFHLRKEASDAEMLVRRALVAVAAFVESRQLTLSAELPKEKIQLFVDPIRFEQILINLLNNAVKYTDRGGSIRLSAEGKDGVFILRVSDTGIGIKAEDLADVFLPFKQMQTNIPRRGTGLGIGLSLTKRLVEMHGGTIEAESAGEGKGSVFTVRLPLGGDVAVKADKIVSLNNNKQHMKHDILIVDDNQAAAEGLSRLLALKGHRVSVAYSGEEALTKAGEVKPDVVLLDIGLPDMDGYEVAKRMRALEKGKKPCFIVALTGYGQEDDKNSAREAGFNYHITKPARIAEIETVLEQME
jgi:signal transduction histidine kinase/ActR/RegA family two-component response regulator